jgi:SAM-dependent methyltransferase
MSELFSNELATCEQLLNDAPHAPLCSVLRRLPLEVFAELLLGVPDHLPTIASRLPTMAPDQVQQAWTGNCGPKLMAQSTLFVRTLVALYANHGTRSLDSSTILDFGCGWGRLLRLMLKYAPAENLYGVDPWEESLQHCRRHRVGCRLALSDYLPRSLLFTGPFELAYAFSVFTHLSEYAATVSLSTLRTVIADNGMLCITIRPVEYWQHVEPKIGAECIEKHRTTGFAFVPHANRQSIEGEVTYGDTSMTPAFLQRIAPGWRICELDWNSGDPLQVLVLLKPV